jgi:hypothetical protein
MVAFRGLPCSLTATEDGGAQARGRLWYLRIIGLTRSRNY